MIVVQGEWARGMAWHFLYWQDIELSLYGTQMNYKNNNALHYTTLHYDTLQSFTKQYNTVH